MAIGQQSGGGLFFLSNKNSVVRRGFRVLSSVVGLPGV